MKIRNLIWASLYAGALLNPLQVQADECKPLQQLLTLPLLRTTTGEVAVKIEVMDSPATLLFDTGSTKSGLTEGFAKKLQLKGISTGTVMTLRGLEKVRNVKAPYVTIGGAKIQNIEFVALTGIGGLDGILSPNLLRDVDFDLDFAGKKINVFYADHCKDKVVYWQSSIVAVVPFDLDRAGLIRLPVVLDGKPLTAVLDTGAGQTSMDMSIATGRYDVDLHGPDVEQAGAMGSGRPIYRHRFKTLAFDSVVVTNPEITLLPNVYGAPPPVSTNSRAIMDKTRTLPEMLLGMSVLSKLHVYIAYKERKIYMTSGESTESPVKAN